MKEQTDSASAPEVEEPYEAPELVDYGSLRELTLSGSAQGSDSFGFNPNSGGS